jgi:hypothetical protein
MPRSMPRRLELLERGRRTPPPPANRDAVLLDLIEQIAELGPSGAPAGFWEAWLRYTTARDELRKAGVQPPPHYLPHLPEPERLRLWRDYDHFDLNGPLLPLVRSAIEWCRTQRSRTRGG